MKKLLVVVLSLVSNLTFAGDLFTIKKNVRPRNILHMSAEISNCKITSPYVTPFWIMGEAGGHREGLNFMERSSFSPYIESSDHDEVKFTIGALSKVDLGNADATITVRVENCQPKAFISIDGQEVQLLSIEANGKFSIFGGWKTNYILIKGLHSDGETFERRVEP